jgi:hypothetical protein
MLKKELIKILVKEKPESNYKNIVFIDPLKKKKNLDELISYSADKAFYKYMERELANKKEIKDYFDNILKKINEM